MLQVFILWENAAYASKLQLQYRCRDLKILNIAAVIAITDRSL
jgi:hypothetical protein